MPAKEKRAKTCHAPENFRFVTHTFSGHHYYTVQEHQRATTPLHFNSRLARVDNNSHRRTRSFNVHSVTLGPRFSTTDF
jgi:hypothetical protein